MYANAVPNIVEQTKHALLQQQPQLPEGPQRGRRDRRARISPAARRRSATAWRKVYANEFTEQELKDLVTFYKSPLGQKLLATEPRAIQFSMSYMNQWAQNFAEIVNAQFRAEMTQARQARSESQSSLRGRGANG